jgi:Tfp pilus assembly protein PilN
MPYINLIQEQKLAERKREQQIRMLFMGVLGVGAVSVLTAVFFTLDASRLNAEAVRLERKKEELQPKLDALETARYATADILPQIQTLESGQESVSNWWNILDHLKMSTPDDIWVTEVRSRRTDAKSPISLTTIGRSLNHEGVGAFMLHLESADQLQNY